MGMFSSDEQDGPKPESTGEMLARKAREDEGFPVRLPKFGLPPSGPSVNQMVEALRAAKQFIENGVEMGFIRMSDYKDDPAHRTLPMIKAALGEKP